MDRRHRRHPRPPLNPAAPEVPLDRRGPVIEPGISELLAEPHHALLDIDAAV